MDSISVWQKVQDGKSAMPKRNSFSSVKTIRFKILNWNSLSLDSNVVRKDCSNTLQLTLP